MLAVVDQYLGTIFTQMLPKYHENPLFSTYIGTYAKFIVKFSVRSKNRNYFNTTCRKYWFSYSLFALSKKNNVAYNSLKNIIYVYMILYNFRKTYTIQLSYLII